MHDWQTAGDCAYIDTSTYLLAYYSGENSCDSEFEENEIIIQLGETMPFEIDHMWLDSDYHFFGPLPVLPNGEA